jgi:hypothetical protein
MMAQPWRSWGTVENFPPLRVSGGALKPEPAERRITTFLERLDAWAPNARAKACPSSITPITRAKGARA